MMGAAQYSKYIDATGKEYGHTGPHGSPRVESDVSDKYDGSRLMGNGFIDPLDYVLLEPDRKMGDTDNLAEHRYRRPKKAPS